MIVSFRYAPITRPTAPCPCARCNTRWKPPHHNSKHSTDPWHRAGPGGMRVALTIIILVVVVVVLCCRLLVLCHRLLLLGYFIPPPVLLFHLQLRVRSHPVPRAGDCNLRSERVFEFRAAILWHAS